MSNATMSELDDAVAQRAKARVGQVLRAKWRLDRLLGVGGMACVFSATHRNGKRGAVKLLHLELSIHEDAKTRFLREGYVANKVDHPGAVSVLDDDIADDGSVFLVMELLEGESVEARVEKRPTKRLEVAEVITIADQLLDVLASAHDKGIVHRDIKPENLFLTTKEQLKVLDFGIARLRELSSTNQATRTGSVMGTPAYMPPEQALGNWSTIDGRTDIWAVGATMFRLLTGRMVHEADTVNKLLLAAMTKHAPPLLSLLPSAPPQLAAIVDGALRFEQEARWPDARTMLKALRDLGAASAPQGLFPNHSVDYAARLNASQPGVAPASFGSQPGAPSQPMGTSGLPSQPAAPPGTMALAPAAMAQPAPASSATPSVLGPAPALGTMSPAMAVPGRSLLTTLVPTTPPPTSGAPVGLIVGVLGGVAAIAAVVAFVALRSPKPPVVSGVDATSTTASAAPATPPSVEPTPGDTPTVSPAASDTPAPSASASAAAPPPVAGTGGPRVPTKPGATGPKNESFSKW